MSKTKPLRYWPRRTMSKIRAYLKWIKQGRPRLMPVVLQPGKIISCRHGHGLAQDWHWHFGFQTQGPIDLAHMVDILGAQYGVERVEELDCCGACQSAVTV